MAAFRGRSTRTLGDCPSVQHTPLPVLAFVGCWLAIMALLACYQALLHSSFNRLRDYHPDVWKRLGEPRVLDLSTFYPARKFLWSKEVLSLDDDVLTHRSRLAYYFGMAGAILGLVLVGTVAAIALLRSSSGT